jgi:hypothetical protein
MTRTIRFYTDEHVPRAVVRGLRERVVDVLTVSEAGLLGASGEEHLARAFAEGRVIFTRSLRTFYDWTLPAASMPG